MKPYKELIINHHSGRDLIFYVAGSFRTRFMGLFSSCINDYDGIMIKPCNSVHTFFLGRPIDVVFLSKDMRVIKVVNGMKSNRVAMCWRAVSVVEMFSGEVKGGFSVGDKING